RVGRVDVTADVTHVRYRAFSLFPPPCSGTYFPRRASDSLLLPGKVREGMVAPEGETTNVEPDKARGVRLYTRAPFTLGWLSDAVLPLVHRANGPGPDRVYLRRGWLHGPHVDVVGTEDTAGDWRDLAAAWDAGPLDPDTAFTEEAYL